MPIYDFKCNECDNVTEHIVRMSVESLPCPDCGADTVRLIGCPNLSISNLAAGASATVDSIDKWDKMRKQKMAIEQKNQDNHGTYD